jgi:hypothetical protein
MVKYQAFSEDTEVIGQNVTAFIECSNRDAILPHLEKHGLDKIQPDKWYPLQDFLDVINDMMAAGGTTGDLVSIGMKMAETAVFPPEFDEMPLTEIMRDWNTAYELNNRGSDIGGFKVEIISDTHVKVTYRIPYPDDYNYGVFFGTAKRFLPEGTDFIVEYDADTPRRDDGGEETVVHIIWGAEAA